MAKIIVDDREYEVKDGQNLLEACLSLGLNLPYFCWHPAMDSVGACRQCAVKLFRDENDKNGRLVMACMTPAADGTRISIEDAEARAFRASIIEWLMTNHPHDCPVCDEGGECHLQDMTVMTGHNYRRYRFGKRTFYNQNLGPLVNQEMNRCIQCYRCVRFYNDYAGGHDFGAFLLHDTVYFGRREDGVLESEFSGNLVEVCPTGVFTDKTLKQHYTRKWDLTTAPSICVNCSLGCNTIPGERYGMLRRIHNRYNGAVNGYFLCDRGRYGYEFVNSERRIRHPILDRKVQGVTKEEALSRAGELLKDPARVIGVGSPRASLEANFALRTLVGPERFFLGISPSEARLVQQSIAILRDGPARTPSLREIEKADAVLVLGEDVLNSAPMLGLALRQSVRQKPLRRAAQMRIPLWDDKAVRELVQTERGPLYVATPNRTRLDEIATRTYRASPQDIARLGHAVAHAIQSDAPVVEELPEEIRSLAEEIAAALKDAERPVVVSGVSLGSLEVMQAAANVAWALCAAGHPAGIFLTQMEVNSLGLGLMNGKTLDEAVQTARSGQVDTLVILENDLYRRMDTYALEELLSSVAHVIVIDHLSNPTTERAEVVLPAATFAEGDGTLVNNEGRAQRFYQVFVPEGEIQESWRWLRDAMAAAGRSSQAPWSNLDDIVAAMAEELPQFLPVLQVAPPAGFRIAGMKVPRQPARYSGRTAMHAHISVHEPKPPDDPDSPLSFTMEGTPLQPPAALIPRFWSPGWNSVQALNRFQEEIAGPLRGGDPGVRLIEPVEGQQPAYFRHIPAPFAARKSEWLVIPLHHIFGSEELSVLSPAVAQLSARPYLVLNPGDAAALSLVEGGLVEVKLNDTAYRLPAKFSSELPAGLAGLPVGLPGMAVASLPAWGRLASETPLDSSAAEVGKQ
jgi:NADH-quinone oxidoreductase subunit G